jgi:hypothetical protein
VGRNASNTELVQVRRGAAEGNSHPYASERMMLVSSSTLKRAPALLILRRW